jgi:asparagine synthase (glutamine-hydrolysing)
LCEVVTENPKFSVAFSNRTPVINRLMCGITGFFSSRSGRVPDIKMAVCRMTEALLHRGPDSAGIWVDPVAGLALGHRRLAIVDLSPAGSQPMHSESARYVIVLNGEVYNFRDLRLQLETRGHVFRGGSDTEVMLAAVEEWGVMGAVPHFNGMFAFALWDRLEQILYLGRDRMGEKPLYYTMAGNVFLFGSELKALLAYPGFQTSVDRNALALYLRHNYVPAPYSIYKGVQKLSPGHILSFRPESGIKITAYWSLKEVARRGVESTLTCGSEEALAQLEELLRDAVRLQMVADVPLGAFLSGGIDSSTIVGMMQAQSNRPVRTFSIGFEDERFDEAKFARAVAARLGTSHTELYVTPQEAIAVIPELPKIYDEPFADSSQIPTYLVSRLARESVTVSLSGDGGDELFGGYRIYQSAAGVYRSLCRIPLPRLMAWMAEIVAATGWLDGWKVGDGKHVGAGILGQRLRNAAQVLRLGSKEELYRFMMSQWRDPAILVEGAEEPPSAFTNPDCFVPFPDILRTMQYIDMISYLPDDILVKVDRAAMAVGLESRVPLLDYRLIEFAWRIPLSMKLQNGEGKWLLRNLGYRYVPRELLDRPKKGFSVPVDAWICGPLREWAEALLNETDLRNEGLNPAPIRKVWQDHVGGIRNSNAMLWDILMYQAWRHAHQESNDSHLNAVDRQLLA